MSTHAHTLEHLGGIRARTNRTGLTLTVVLSMSNLTDTTKSMTLHDALETMTLRDSYYIYEAALCKQLNGNSVTQIQVIIKTCELGQVSLWCYTGFLEVSHQGCCGILFLCILETKLDGLITILLDTLNLSNNTRTYFDNSAWYILTLGTEYGCHSDFLS